jgi:hypothetical protein
MNTTDLAFGKISTIEARYVKFCMERNYGNFEKLTAHP